MKMAAPAAAVIHTLPILVPMLTTIIVRGTKDSGMSVIAPGAFHISASFQSFLGS